MVVKPDSGQTDTLGGEHAAPPASPRRGPGRPKGLTSKVLAARAPAGLDKVSKAQQEQRAVIKRQREDCRRLGTVIKQATPGTGDPKDIAALARSTSILHGLERDAYDFGSTPGQVKAVIVVHAKAENMETWQKNSESVLGRMADAITGPAPRKIEADVLDEPEEGPDDE